MGVTQWPPASVVGSVLCLHRHVSYLSPCIAAVMTAALVAGCAGSVVGTRGWASFEPVSEDCFVFRVAGDGPVGAHGSSPQVVTVYASRPAFRHSLQDAHLFSFDCAGTPVAGLASSWRYDPDTNVWRFRVAGIRDSTRVRAGWEATKMFADTVFVAGDEVNVVGTEVSAPSSREHPLLPFRAFDIAVGPAEAPTDVIRVLPTPGDERDLVDRRVDVLVTRDPLVLDYARRDAARRVVSLWWDRVYVLLGPTGLRVAPSDVQSLSTEAVRVDALPASSLDGEWCAGAGAENRRRVTPSGDDVAYLEGDDVARAIADRVVSLAARGRVDGERRPGAVARPVVEAELIRRLRSDQPRYRFFVLPVEAGTALASHPAATRVCEELARTIGVEWLGPETATPLVLTRDYAVLSGRVGLWLDFRGRPVVERLEVGRN